MKNTLKTLSVILSLGILLSGCATNGSKNDTSQTNERTVVKFIIKANKDNKAKFEIKTPKGTIDINDLLAEAKKSKGTVKTKKSKNANGKMTQDIFIQLVDGSCTAMVCLPSIPCFPVIIDPINNCPDF